MDLKFPDNSRDAKRDGFTASEIELNGTIIGTIWEKRKERKEGIDGAFVTLAGKRDFVQFG